MQIQAGDLVRLRCTILHESRSFDQGVIGMVLKTIEPMPSHPAGVAQVQFDTDEIHCYWSELDIVNKSANIS
jgi:hypothetical protein